MLGEVGREERGSVTVVKTSVLYRVVIDQKTEVISFWSPGSICLAHSNSPSSEVGVRYNY